MEIPTPLASDENIYEVQSEKKKLRGYAKNLRSHGNEDSLKRAQVYTEKVEVVGERYKGFIEKSGGIAKAKELFLLSKKESTMKYYEAYTKTTVPVESLIPSIKLNGLVTKNTPPEAWGKDLQLFDEDQNRKIKHLQSGYSTTFASLLFIEDVSSDEREVEYKKRYGEKKDTIDRKRKESMELEEIRDAVDSAFKDQIVVDIAAGANLFAYRMVDHAKAKSFIAVEPAFCYDLHNRLFELLSPEIERESASADSQEERFRQNKELNKIPVAIVAEDMLGFLKRLPSNSVSVWCSGIDYLVIPDQKYRDEVAKEILRVLHPDGSYVGQKNMSIKLPKTTGIQVSEFGDKEDKTSNYSAIEVYKKNPNTSPENNFV